MLVYYTFLRICTSMDKDQARPFKEIFNLRKFIKVLVLSTGTPSPWSSVPTSSVPMTAMLLILVFALFATASAECQTSDLKWKFEPEIKDSSLDAFVIANGFMRPRGIQWAHDTLFVVDRGRGIISLVEDTTDPTCNGWAAKVVIDNPDFSHGLHINGTQLYASTFDRVLRYQWDPTSQTVSQEEVLVTGMDLAEGLPGLVCSGAPC